jgi:hypothetical protein
MLPQSESNPWALGHQNEFICLWTTGQTGVDTNNNSLMQKTNQLSRARAKTPEKGIVGKY